MKTDRLNTMQAMTLTTSSILSVEILRAQQTIAQIAGQDAWISIALGGLVSLAAGMVCYILASLYPDKDFPEINLDIAGKFIGRILLLGFIVYMILYVSLSLRAFAQALKMFLLDRTPLQSLVLFMALVAGYAVYKGLYTIGGVVDVVFPIILITIITIILLSIPQSSLINLKPVMFDNTKEILKSVMPSFQNFTGFGIVLYFLSHTDKTKSTLIWYLLGILIPVVLYTCLTVVSVAVFGPKDLLTLIYPTLTLLKAIEFPATFLERLESFAAVLWIAVIFVSVVSFYYMSTRNLVVFFGIKSKHLKYVVWSQIPVFYFIATFEESGLMVLEYAHKLRPLQAVLSLFIVPVLTIIALFKKRKGKSQ
jgi:spore germination protein